MKTFTKQELIEQIINIFHEGWHKSVKKTIDTRNDGAVGNTLERLLGIKENNLPIPNAAEWELKGQRSKTSSLITLKHREPSPQGAKIVSSMLLPYYGWKHKEAGGKYPKSERSFRSTTSATEFTCRGFKIIVDREQKKLRFIFDSNKADTSLPEISAWLADVDKLIGLGPLSPEPYWGFDDLMYEIGAKIKNCFYVVADRKIEDKHEYFKYIELCTLTQFSFDNFLNCIESGKLLVDFDARTGHNHGTKFRLKQGYWADLYKNMKIIHSD